MEDGVGSQAVRPFYRPTRVAGGRGPGDGRRDGSVGTAPVACGGWRRRGGRGRQWVAWSGAGGGALHRVAQEGRRWRVGPTGLAGGRYARGGVPARPVPGRAARVPGHAGVGSRRYGARRVGRRGVNALGGRPEEWHQERGRRKEEEREEGRRKKK
uniref:Uncharacterized protein n=1 Tax=Setaria viridis TaxID=4556 RepID=A0A4U6U6J7_SETVI|nr:hypothetical protein SEVIR_6G225850v2 [Setaria viridis]